MERQALVSSICQTITDYRSGELAPPTPDHVERWIRQFDQSIQLPVLAEMAHVLQRTYISRESVTDFLRNLVKTEELAGSDPCAFWSTVKLLNIQQGGNSQREMNTLFDSALEMECGIRTYTGEGMPDTYVYLDDGLFTGGRVKADIEQWIEYHAPANCKLHAIFIATHQLGEYYASKEIDKIIARSRKNITITWWSRTRFENRLRYSYSSDVLWPTTIPEEREVQSYANGIRQSIAQRNPDWTLSLRTPGSIGNNAIFSSDTGRITLEQAFLSTGVYIRNICPNLGIVKRPLGHMMLDSLGFGSLLVTFRNCPNNAPLALWVGDPWYPLFPRKTNAQTADQNLLSRLMTNGF